MRKVELILVDGMRPDALAKCANPYIQKLLSESLVSLEAKTVFPSVTLPCHMSLFHSVEPTRHGITTNTFSPQVRPIKGIAEQIIPRTSAMFFNWEELTDLTRPGGNMICKEFSSGHHFGYETANQMVTDSTIRCIKEHAPDFCFTYLGWTDEAGHAHGWMTEEYYRSLDESFACIERILKALPEDYVAIIVADHGGHDRLHGTTMDEDMLIPVIIHGKNITPGTLPSPVSILDIAPTIATLLERESAPEWEGKNLLPQI